MYSGQSETDAIMSDPDALKAIGMAENEVVLATFKQGILDLAQEIVDWEIANAQSVNDADIFQRVQDMLEQALQARASIRRRYKISLL